MTQRVQIPDDQLTPGDLVDAYYQIRPGASDYLVQAAVHDVKQTLSSDPRFRYQGSTIEPRVDPDDNQIYQYLIVSLQVADPSKVMRTYTPVNVEEAGVGMVLVPIVVLVGILAALAASHDWALTYKTFLITRQTEAIANSDMTPEQKVAAIKGAQRQNPGIGSSIAALGGSLVTAAIILGVLWALSLSSRGRGDK